MTNTIETLMNEITSNETVKKALSHHTPNDVDVVLEITCDLGTFDVRVSGEAFGRKIRGLFVSGSGETLEEALHALKQDIEDNL